jgi:hypothetical protein
MDLSILDTGFHDLLRYEGYADYAKEAGREVPPREVCMLSHYTLCYPRTITSEAFAFSLSYSHSPIEDFTVLLPDFRRRLGLTVS